MLIAYTHTCRQTTKLEWLLGYYSGPKTCPDHFSTPTVLRFILAVAKKKKKTPATINSSENTTDQSVIPTKFTNITCLLARYPTAGYHPVY